MSSGGKPRIAGVQIVPLREIIDDRGSVLHMLRSDAPHFQQFGEIYFSWINPGAIKAWNRHREMVLNYAVPVGRVRVALVDERPDSVTSGSIDEVVLGRGAYSLLIVPPGLWTGFQCLGDSPAMIANCATIPHDPSEIERADWRSDRINYRWT